MDGLTLPILSDAAEQLIVLGLALWVLVMLVHGR